MSRKKWTSALLLNACGEVLSHKVTVLGEDGKPVENAKVEFLYVGYDDEDTVADASRTDNNGVVESSGKARLRIQLEVTKEGYYTTSYHKAQGTELDRNKPHDLEVILREKIKPIPLYAKKLSVEVPLLKEEVGYDLKIGDWVKPHGKGETADFNVLAKKSYTDGQNYKTTVSFRFLGKHSGAIENSYNKATHSEYKNTRNAPLESKYHSLLNFVRTRSSKTGRKGSTGLKSFLYRTRVQLDEHGEIESCHYGKMIDAVSVAKGAGKPDQKPIVSFTYYFNSTPNDRNLEFDPEKNLFKSLKHEEQVWEP